MRIDKLNRRMFLQGAGGATLSIPFLTSLLSPHASAAPAAGQARRFIAIKSYSAQTIVDWYPTLNGNGYQTRTPANSDGAKADGTTILTQQLGNTPYTWAPLADFATDGMSPILDTGLNGYLDKMLLLRGLDFLPSTNHNDGGMLGNFAASEDKAVAGLPHVPTIDQVLAHSDKFYPDNPIVRSLHLAPGGQNSCSFTHDGIVDGPIRQIQAHLDPLSAFNEIFNAPGVEPPNPEDPELTVNPNIALVDRVYQDYTSMRESSRLGAQDRQTLERHMTFLAELQGNLQGGGGVPCEWPAEPRSISDEYGLDVMDLTDAYSLMIDVLVAAIICDHTRVVTLDIRKALSDGRGGSFAGYYHGADNPSTWHGDAHSWGDPASDHNIQRINNWIANDVFGRILERLDVDEGDGSTYLDNSLVMWGNELGFNHLNWSVPTLTAGSAGGCIDTGRYIDFIEWDTQSYFAQNGGNVIRGIPYNQYLVSVLQAFGLEPADYERGGTPGYGSIETVGKSASTHAIDYNFGAIGDPLPTVLI